MSKAMLGAAFVALSVLAVPASAAKIDITIDWSSLRFERFGAMPEPTFENQVTQVALNTDIFTPEYEADGFVFDWTTPVSLSEGGLSGTANDKVLSFSLDGTNLVGYSGRAAELYVNGALGGLRARVDYTYNIVGCAPSCDDEIFRGKVSLNFNGSSAPGNSMVFFDTGSGSGTLEALYVNSWPVFSPAPVSLLVIAEGYSYSAVAAVPEPATTAMLLAGLGVVAGVARRRLPA
jgi:hypothetical protein